MSDTQQLAIQATPRQDFGKRNKRLRGQGVLPAVLYGQGKESVSIQVSSDEFSRVYKQAGESTLVNLVIEGDKPRKVLIHDVAQHFMKNQPVHVDFYEVDLTKKINAPVAIHFVGESPAVKESGGTLVKSITEVEVEALPADLPNHFEVDISKLATFEDQIKISDISVPANVEILDNPEEVIALVQAPRSEEELAELEETTPSEEEAKAVEELAGEEGEGEEGEEKDTEESGKPDGGEEDKKEGGEDKAEG